MSERRSLYGASKKILTADEIKKQRQAPITYLYFEPAARRQL
jgi:hypothetical protein